MRIMNFISISIGNVFFQNNRFVLLFTRQWGVWVFGYVQKHSCFLNLILIFPTKKMSYEERWRKYISGA